MKNAIILHGKPSKDHFYDVNFPSFSNYYWLPWLQKQLVVREIPTQTPEVPNGWIADYPTWQKEFERYDIGPETILVGHSCGGGFLARWLSEHKDISVGKVVLVAPWIDPDKKFDSGDFFEFTIDPDLVKRTAGVTIFNSDDDGESVKKSAQILKEKIEGVKYKEFHEYGHFFDDRRMQFPELLQEIIG
jgi:predicted alpha/beta hydrolase family esterase